MDACYRAVQGSRFRNCSSRVRRALVIQCPLLAESKPGLTTANGHKRTLQRDRSTLDAVRVIIFVPELPRQPAGPLLSTTDDRHNVGPIKFVFRGHSGLAADYLRENAPLLIHKNIDDFVVSEPDANSNLSASITCLLFVEGALIVRARKLPQAFW